MTPGGWKKEKIKYEIPLVLAHQLPLQTDSPSASGLAGHAVLAHGLLVRLPWVPSRHAFGPLFCGYKAFVSRWLQVVFLVIINISSKKIETKYSSGGNIGCQCLALTPSCTELGEGSEASDSTFPGTRRQGYLTCKFSTLLITL